MHIDRPIVIALAIFVIILLVFFLVMPEYKTFTSLQTQLGEKTAEYNAEFDYYSAISKTYFELQSRQDDVNKIDNALPQDSNIGEAIYFLQKTAKADGLVLKNLSLSKSSAKASAVGTAYNLSDSVKDITFSINLSGNYASLENFIISLEKSSRLFEVTSIVFDSASGPPYNFNLQVKTHSY